MLRTSYFLGNRLLGSSNQLPWWSDTQQVCRSDARLCPSCGDIWARIQVAGMEWACSHHTCNRCRTVHGSLGEPGSFLHPWQRNFGHLPREVLIYEIQLRILNFTKE